MTDTIFGKMVAGDIAVQPVYEDEHCLAINDIHPQAPVHVLVIPKRSLAKLSDATDADQALLGHLLLAVTRIAKALDIADGYRVVINNGEAGGQTVFHLHLHILGGLTQGEAGL